MMQDKPVLLMKKVINLFFRELDAMNTEKLQEPISGHNMIVIEYLTKHEEPVYQRDLENHDRLWTQNPWGSRPSCAYAGRKAVSQFHRRRNGYTAASFEKTGA